MTGMASTGEPVPVWVRVCARQPYPGLSRAGPDLVDARKESSVTNPVIAHEQPGCIKKGIEGMESQRLTCPLHPQVRLRVRVAEPVHAGAGSGADQDAGLECPRCGRVWPVVDGIPDFVSPRVTPGSLLEAESRQWDEHAAQYDESRVRDAVYVAGVDAAAHALAPRAGELVLDAGCGTGLSVRRYWYPEIQVVGLDLSLESLRYQRRREHPPVELVRGDLTELPFPDATFDRVLCANALQHIPDENDRLRCVRELARVARPGARIIISAHNYSVSKQRAGYCKEGTAGSPSGHVQYIYRFDVDEFRCLLESTLAVERIAGAGFPLPYRFKLSPLSRRLERVLWRSPWWVPSANMLVGVCRKGDAS